MGNGYCGTTLWKPAFLSPEEVSDAVRSADALSASRKPLMEHPQWFGADLDVDGALGRRLSATIGTRPDFLSFYYLEPGGKLHPHRDLTGASLNSRIRFHIPIATNSAVDFFVGGERVDMRPGDLWIVDTSYTHSVENRSSQTRVHLVAECVVTETVRAVLPSGWPARLHDVAFVLHLAAKFGQAVIVNSVLRPRYFVSQMRMIAHVAGWRLFGRPYS